MFFLKERFQPPQRDHTSGGCEIVLEWERECRSWKIFPMVVGKKKPSDEHTEVNLVDISTRPRMEREPNWGNLLRERWTCTRRGGRRRADRHTGASYLGVGTRV